MGEQLVQLYEIVNESHGAVLRSGARRHRW
jgi:hypothetical protein